MSVLVGKQAPQFQATAVMNHLAASGRGISVQNFLFSAASCGE